MIEAIQDTPAYLGHNRYGTAFTDLDWKRQLQILLEVSGRQHLLRDKTVGRATKKARAEISFQAFKTLHRAGLHIKNVLNFSQRHMQALADNWREGALAAATLQTRFSVMRWFAASTGKNGMIKDAVDYGIPAESIKRSYVTTIDKSWSAHDDISFQDLIAQIYAKDPWVAMRLELQEAFGLRIQEATLMQPLVSDGGAVLRLEHGTKGGRSRFVPIRTEKQRDVLNRAKAMARMSENGNLIPGGKKLAQALARSYYVCGLFGITKSQLEITPHGLRAAYANDRYQELSGMPSAVRGTPAVYDPEKDRMAREIVALELGHTRVSITGAYTGARPKGRPRIIRIEDEQLDLDE